jgi:hypothetical protein
MAESLVEKAQKLKEEGLDLGHMPSRFEIGGRNQFMNLIYHGLLPQSTLLDIGCGCLRGGYWFIHFLDKGGYCGIEPNQKVLDAGIHRILEPGLMEEKQPRFDTNAAFDLSVFGQKFDFMLAFSVWTHCPKSSILAMLDGFVQNSNPGGVFLTTFQPATLLKHEYTGEVWKRRAPHERKLATLWARQRFSWVRQECTQRGLIVERPGIRALEYWDQVWLKISHIA